jgi:hypothetical protein
MPEYVQMILAGALGAAIGTELVGDRGIRPVHRIGTMGAGFVAGMAAGWLLLEGIIQAWRHAGWLTAFVAAGLLLITAIGLRRLDERCPSWRSVSSYCADGDTATAGRR